jgi:hypothetical protein
MGGGAFVLLKTGWIAGGSSEQAEGFPTKLLKILDIDRGVAGQFHGGNVNRFITGLCPVWPIRGPGALLASGGK